MSSTGGTKADAPAAAPGGASRMQAQARRGRRASLAAIAFATSLLLAAGGALFFKLTGAITPIGAAQESTQRLNVHAFPNTGSVVFSNSDSEDAAVNPSEARIEDIPFDTISITWQIRNAETDHIIDEGTGNVVDAALQKLMSEPAQGDFLLDFFVADRSYNIYGASRQFSITHAS